MDRSAPRPVLRPLVLGLALVAGLLGASMGFLVLGWKRDIANERQAIEASGASLHPAGLPTPPEPGSPWWAREEVEDPLGNLGIQDPDTLAALLERPDDELAPFPRGLLEDESLALRSQLIAPAVLGAFDSAAGVHAAATLASAVLLGRREGVDAARAWLDARVDPFSGEPYRTQVGPTGDVRAWSVGPDAESDATEHLDADLTDDIVVQIPGS